MADRNATLHLKGDVSAYVRSLAQARTATSAFIKSLDSSNDRMSMLVQSSLALGPALVPVGATAVPAIAGLANQLAFATAAAGTAALAFSGVGDALKALNEFSLEPSAANFEKLEESMRTLGPAGRDFAVFLQGLRPEMQRLQDVAQEGLFPGVEVGLTELMDLLPEVEGIVSEVSSTLGQLVAEGGQSLNSPEWEDFFAFLENEARPTLIDMGRTLGNFTRGFAELWMAFDPVSDRFSDSFLRMSRDFAAWADGLDQTQGFQDFVDYLAQTSPMVWETLGALGAAMVDLLVAAAPVGAVALPIIEALADVLGAIAESDVGPILIGAAAGISAISRAVALYNTAQGSQMAGLFSKTALGGAGRAAKDLPAASRAYLDFGAALDKTGPKVGAFASTSDRLRASMGAAGKIGAGVGGLAFVMSDLDNKVGLSNTAMLTLLGTMAGPWGAAAGAAIGLTKDLGASTEALSSAIERANKAAASGDYEQLSAAMAELNAQIEASASGQASFGQKLANSAETMRSQGGIIGGLGGLIDQFSTSSIEGAAASADLADEHEKARAKAQEQAFEEAGLTAQMNGASAAARAQTESLLRNIDTLNARRDALLANTNKEIAFEQAIDDASAAARKNGDTLDLNTQAGRDNMTALTRLAGSWNDLEPAQQNAAGASERARSAFIRTAMQMGKTRAQAEALADKLLDIPAEVTTRVRLYGAPAAGSALDRILAKINALPSQKTIGIKVVGGTQTREADGGIHERGVKTFADGGFDQYGRWVSRVPQIRSGSMGTVQWAERETGWEAYISGKPSQLARNREVWAEAGERLGMRVAAYADGAIARQAPRPMQYATPVAAAVVDTRPRLHVIEAAIDDGFIRVVAEEVADDRIQDYRSMDGELGRMSVGGGV